MAMVNVGGVMTSEYVSQRIAINRGRVHAKGERGYTICDVFIRAGWHTDNHSPMVINCPGCRRVMREQGAEIEDMKAAYEKITL